jgi:enamine deaminase RidA (YjgF/YER057c/UK114 family)
VARRSIEVGGLSHLNPLPAASRVGPLVETSIITPFNPGTRDVPPEVDAQIENLFHHAGEILTAAGATWDDVVKMTFFVGDLKVRQAINEPWVRYFPDPASRPARHSLLVTMDDPAQFARCELTAYVEDR